MYLWNQNSQNCPFSWAPPTPPRPCPTPNARHGEVAWGRTSHTSFVPGPCGPRAWGFTGMVMFWSKWQFDPKLAGIVPNKKSLVVARGHRRPNVVVGDDVETKCPDLNSLDSSRPHQIWEWHRVVLGLQGHGDSIGNHMRIMEALSAQMGYEKGGVGFAASKLPQASGTTVQRYFN